MKYAYKIFTDATADLNDDMLCGLPEVEVIPMEIVLGGRYYTYGLHEESILKYFYDTLRAGSYASTSQINPEVFCSCFEKALIQGYDILYLGFSSGMSGCVSSAEWACMDLREKYPDRTILCVDTLCASVGEGFLVMEAARKQKEGMDILSLENWVKEYRLKVCHWFTVDTFEHLKHGGRVSAASAMLGTALNIKPLLHVTNEGELQVKEKPRGNRKALHTQLKYMKEGWDPSISNRVIVGHADCILNAMELRDEVQFLYPEAEIILADIGAVIGSHVGPGMLALIYWGNNR